MLTDAHCKNATCPPEKLRARFADSGGLYLEVSKSGSKRWFWKYRKSGKEGRMAFGSYPSVSLNGARRARDAAKIQKSDGIDPVQARKVEKLKATNPAGESFKIVALEWFQKFSPNWSDAHAIRTKRQLERDLFPWLGNSRMADIEPVELLATIRKVEARGAVETANRELALCSLVWRYAFSTGRVNRDIASDLKGALTPYRGKHFAAITDPGKLGELILASRAYKGGPVVRSALQLSPYVLLRPGELRAARWDEFDLDAGVWIVPSARMKRSKEAKENGEPHIVPLSRQVIAILRDLKPYTESTGLVFPGERNRERPISENSVRTALISLGYTSEIQTWHGFRATARTMLAERLGVDGQVADAQLAHAVPDANGRSYNRTTFIEQRSEMMQTWADYLDQLADAVAKS